ncbi:glycosyltransferase family 4 protein [bacterium]|nr:glycosyltransferase family 4 protein [bacterium]
MLISEASRVYYVNTVGRFFPGFEERVVVIDNGLDWEKFRPTQPQAIYEYVNIPPGTTRPVLLHPHRPEPSKGIMQTLAVADKLVHEYGFHDLLVLAPQWHVVQASSELSEFYAAIEHEIAVGGLRDHVVFHGWIPQDLMPEYYSLGRVTLSLGHFVESFGNAVYESMGCGTPSIAARISTHRDLLPDDLLVKVDYGDI